MIPEILTISAFSGVFLIVLGAAMIAAASMTQQRQRYHDLDYLKLVLRSVGASVATFGVLSWIVLIVGLVVAADRGVFSPVLAVLLLPVWLIFAAAGFAGLGALRSASTLAHEMTEAQIFDLERRMTFLKSIGWCLVVLAFCSALLPFGALFVVSIVAAAAVSGGSLRTKQNSLLWLMAICSRRNLPLADEIESLAATFSGRFRHKSQQLAEQLRLGKSLPQALREIPGLVPQQALLAIDIGAQTGTLPQALREAAQRESERLIAGSGRLSSPSGLLLYWSLLICVIGAIVAYLAIYSVPKLKRIFEDFHFEPPAVSQLLFHANDMALSYLAVFLALAIVPVLGVCGLVVAQFYGWDSVPTWGLGRFFLRLDTPGLLRGLSRAVASHQPLDDSIDRLAEMHRRNSVRRRLHHVFYAIKRGEDGWHALQREHFITAHECSLLQAAQRAGNLPWALQQLAESIERRFDHRLGQLGETLQPAFVICAGLTVLLICISIFFPFVQLVQFMPGGY